MRPRDAPATYALLLLTIVVSAALTLTGWDDQAALVAGFIPARLTGMGVAPLMGWQMPVWATPLSCTLVHAGLIHLGLNMVMLCYCGSEAERALGTRAIICLYVVGAFAAAAGQWAQDRFATDPMVGASGAISALIGAYALLYGRSRARDLGPAPAALIHALWLAAAWTGIQLLVGVAGLAGSTRIAIGAHIGGFLVGLALARPLLLWRYRRA